MSGVEANAEMIEGYKDGLDVKAPEPSANRSHSYRHGFKAGRADRAKTVAWKSFDEAERAAAAAMALDDSR